jgi:hypothetical protein
MFLGKAVKHLSGAPLWGRLLALPSKFRLGWKGLLGTKNLAYYGISLITTVKSFIRLSQVTNIILP